MTSPNDRASAAGTSELPGWLVALCLVVAVVSLAGIWFLDRASSRPESALGWLLMVTFGIPAYFALDSIGSDALRGLFQGRRWLSRLSAAAVIVVFYTAWFLFLGSQGE